MAKERLGALEAVRLGDAAGERDAGAMAQRLALKTLGEREGAPRALVREQHHELVAADPVGGVGRAHRGAQALAEGAEARVAGLVAERVVDLLQAVEIEHHDAEARARARTAGELALEVLVERRWFPSPVRLSVSAACARRRCSASRARSTRRR